MAENRTICTKNNIDYISIRMAMAKGARTVEDLVEMAGICAECEGCKAEVKYLVRFADAKCISG